MNKPLLIMFNTLLEHFFLPVSSESMEMTYLIISKRDLHAIVPLGEVRNDLWSLCCSISPCLRKMIGYCLEWIDPHTGISCRSLFSCYDGDHFRAGLIGLKTPNVFRGAFLSSNTSPSLTNCEWNKGEGQNGELLSS